MSLSVINRDVGGYSTAGLNITTPARSHSAGSLLVAMFTWQQSTFGGVSDTAGNTWHDTGISFLFGSNNFRIYYAYNITGNAANVVTVTLTGTNSAYSSLVVYEITGAGTSDPFDTTSTGTGTGTSIATGTLTIAGSSDVICALMIAGPTITGGSGYTLVNFGEPGADNTAYFADEYHVVTANEAATATCPSQSWGIAAAAFKAASITAVDWLVSTNQPVREQDKVVCY